VTMKKILIILAIIVVVGLIYFFIFPYKVQRVCFGDVCPQNSAIFLLYRLNYTKEQCLAKGAYPIEGIGWGLVYAGCSPIDNQLIR
jgi:hypothetical protein